MTSILIVDPDKQRGQKLSQELVALGVKTMVTAGNAETLACLDDFAPDIVILDEEAENLTPGRFLDVCEQRQLDTFVLVITQQTDIERIMDWMMEGTFACLRKPVDLSQLRHAILKGLENKEAYRQVVSLTQDLKRSNQDLTNEKKALKDKTDDLNFLYDLGTKLSATLDCREIFKTVSSSLSQAFGVDLVIILTLFASDEPLRIYTTHVLPDGMIDRMVHETAKPHGVLGREVDIVDQGGHRIEHFPERFQDVPLVTAGNTCGLLRVGLKQDKPFDPGKTLLLQSAAFQTAQALFNAHQHERALHLASHDPLTGLFNRRAFQRHLDLEFDRYTRYGTEFTLVMLDLDFFKTVNDRFGHDAGDMVLKQFAKLMREQVRASDITARIGGEEFIMLLANTSGHHAWRQAERIRKAIKKVPFVFQNVTYYQTVSLGVADTTSTHVKSTAELFTMADKALYQAKRDGRDTTRRSVDIDLAVAIG